MGNRTVKWLPTAERQFEAIAVWYQENVGNKAMKNFVKDTTNAIAALSAMPTIGIRDNRRSTLNDEYRSFASHKLISILYRYTENTLTIVALRSTRMGG